MATIARRLLIAGKVQGVCFRAWTEQNARALGIAGWVRNLASGEVEARLQGSEDAVAEMIRRSRRGPPAAAVRDVRVESVALESFDGFRQLRTGR